ncbi:MAG TPA: hypothetical protein VMU84_08630, partial [Thermoanaerobaculia bacterium]|nr:hypothetical protein [Thermoanaerobaculia bacterium]
MERAGLVGFGALQIAVGTVCAAMLLGTVAGAEEWARRGLTQPAVAPAIFLLGLAAFYFVTVGVGSIRARRWARALAVAVSSLWLAGGVIATIAALIIRARVDARGISLLVASVIVPITLVAFYSRNDVRALIERLDTKRRWTD